jgi:hypothetical protein
MGKLKDKAVQVAQPRDKQYGISDGDSLPPKNVFR